MLVPFSGCRTWDLRSARPLYCTNENKDIADREQRMCDLPSAQFGTFDKAQVNPDPIAAARFCAGAVTCDPRMQMLSTFPVSELP